MVTKRNKTSNCLLDLHSNWETMTQFICSNSPVTFKLGEGHWSWHEAQQRLSSCRVSKTSPEVNWTAPQTTPTSRLLWRQEMYPLICPLNLVHLHPLFWLWALKIKKKSIFFDEPFLIKSCNHSLNSLFNPDLQSCCPSPSISDNKGPQTILHWTSASTKPMDWHFSSWCR